MHAHDTKLHYHCDDWMNDPKLFFWEGEYHVFFQYKWPRHWGHVKSRDLLHWEELPVALTPDPVPHEAMGCWTGCCVRANGQFHIFYTAASTDERQVTCHATSDDLITWHKDPANPILAASAPYNSAPRNAWRDPCVWRHEDTWYMAQCAEVGTNVKNAVTGCIALMKSRDLKHWEMLPPLHVSDGMMMCECPDIFPLDGKWAGLFGCHKPFSIVSDAMLGKYRLNPHAAQVDGDVFYAGKTLLDDKGRRILWGFLFDYCGFEFYFERWKNFLSGRAWTNALSFPRVLSFTEKGELASRFPEEFLRLRKKEIAWSLGNSAGHWRAEGNTAAGAPENDFAWAMLNNVQSDCFEITAKVKLNGAKKAGFLVRCNEGLVEDATGIFVCGQTRSVWIENLGGGLDAPRTRLWDAFYTSPSLSVSTPVTDGVETAVELRIIVDVSVIEVCVNNKAFLTGRCYPKKDSLSAGLFAVSGGAVFEDVRVWELGL